MHPGFATIARPLPLQPLSIATAILASPEVPDRKECGVHQAGVEMAARSWESELYTYWLTLWYSFAMP